MNKTETKYIFDIIINKTELGRKSEVYYLVKLLCNKYKFGDYTPRFNILAYSLNIKEVRAEIKALALENNINWRG